MKYLLIAFVVFQAGCSPTANFVTARNSLIGHKFGALDSHERIKVSRRYPNGDVQYLVESGKCRYAVLTDGRNVIKSWWHVSDPKLCRFELDWGGPW